MRNYRGWLCLAIFLGISFAPRAACAPGYDPYLINNLTKSRDALLQQSQELQRAYGEVQAQMDRLNQRLTRINQYQRQVNTALNDVEAAIRNAR